MSVFPYGKIDFDNDINNLIVPVITILILLLSCEYNIWER